MMGTRTPAIWLNHAAFWQMLAKSWQIDQSTPTSRTKNLQDKAWMGAYGTAY